MRRLSHIALAAMMLLPLGVHAQDFTGQLDRAGTEVYGSADAGNFNDVLGSIIAALLGFLGVIFLVLIIYAGFLWMTAGGNTDQVKKARSLLINSAIGLLITVSAYAIAGFVLDAVQF